LACGDKLAVTGPGVFSSHEPCVPRAGAASASVSRNSSGSRAFSRLRLCRSALMPGTAQSSRLQASHQRQAGPPLLPVTARQLARDELWDVAVAQHGFVTVQQATDLGVSKQALQMLVHRGALTRAAFGVYRFPRYPVGEHDGLMLAVLWTRASEAALSASTAARPSIASITET